MGGFALATLRWLLTGQLPDSLLLLIIAQTLRAATFGSSMPPAPNLGHF